MSGICGCVNLDGASVEDELVRAMTSRLAFRGPDAQEHWTQGPVGLGHAMLRTTFEAAQERQPASLDGRTWIAADARIDARAELEAKLVARGCAEPGAATDAELILHAYRAWGEDCVHHLLGDFAFAIWDSERRSLFCARDHFGVKPFFFAQRGASLVFANTLDGVRGHPAVSSELDEQSIADFLLFEMHRDPAATAFRMIRRLPPAHALTAAAGRVRTRRYWDLPFEASVVYREAQDYVERFRELLKLAVEDRMRTDRVGVELTGGMDSTSIAATAVALRGAAIHGFTSVFESLVPDDERRFAAMAGRALGIPVKYLVADGFALYEGWEEGAAAMPEPVHNPRLAAMRAAQREAAAFSRVALTGWDGDSLLNESPKPYLRALWGERRWGTLASGIARYALSQRRIVPLSVRGRLNFAREEQAPGYPAWIAPALESRLGLRERWREAQSGTGPAHPIRPYAFRSLSSIMEQSNFFEFADAGVTRLHLEHRHPLMDLRLQRFCLSLPPLPWCVKKEIARRAMSGILPEPVRKRPKTALAGSPEMELLRLPQSRWIDRFQPARELARFVDRAKVPPVCGVRSDREARWRDLRPLSLDLWLRTMQAA